MRIIRVDEEDSGGNTLLWIAAGATIGLVAGALAAERSGGRRLSARSLWRRSRGLAELAIEQWQPLVAAALAVRDAWNGRDDYAGPAEGYEVAADEYDDEDEEELGPDDEGDLDEADDDALDARVLEAFSNDPILSERAVEIEEESGGRILLHGRVHAASEVAHAVTLAGGVPGVTAVRQRLRVRDRR